MEMGMKPLLEVVIGMCSKSSSWLKFLLNKSNGAVY